MITCSIVIIIKINTYDTCTERYKVNIYAMCAVISLLYSNISQYYS